MRSLILVLALTMGSTAMAAWDVDVDMPPSGDPKVEMIRVTINDCVTKFKIPKKEFEKFSKNNDAMDQLVKLAIKNTNSGCKN
jgi:hypothetical protein